MVVGLPKRNDCVYLDSIWPRGTVGSGLFGFRSVAPALIPPGLVSSPGGLPCLVGMDPIPEQYHLGGRTGKTASR